MTRWVWRGLRTGVRTTTYPAALEPAPGVSPGFPLGVEVPPARREDVTARCPTRALRETELGIVVDPRRCVHCFRCVRESDAPLAWSHAAEWATAGAASEDSRRRFDHAFDRSVHVLVVDAGDCGACLHEVRQLNNPYYNMHRLGFFLTPTPRHADVLLVVGPVTDHMRVALLKAYDAMPTPKRVVAVGACALTGGVFGPSFVSEAGVAAVLPVDVEVPGQPPSPLSILHGLLVAVGRAAPVGTAEASAP